MAQLVNHCINQNWTQLISDLYANATTIGSQIEKLEKTVENLEKKNEELKLSLKDYLKKENDANILNSRAIGFLPRGIVMAIATAQIDLWFNLNGVGQGEYAGWYLCDGKNDTPDLRGRTLVGRDASNSLMSHQYDQIGFTGGSSSVKLNAQHIPEHSHKVKLETTSSGGHKHELEYTRTVFVVEAGSFLSTPERNLRNKDKSEITTTEVDGAHTHLVEGETIGTVGASEQQPLDIRNPYYVVAYIIYKGI